ncbi:MAG: lysophospholipid acyltransferase family protein [Acidimicrobiales bacterium]
MILYQLVRGLIQIVARLYWRATFEGLHNVPASGAFVLAPVHRSIIDFGLVSGVTRRRMRYMGKEELWSWRPLGWFISTLGAFPVHRGAADRDALHRCLEELQAGEPVVLFPEGARRSGPVVENLFEGASYVASRAGVPVVPVAIAGSEQALPKGSRLPRPVRVHVVVGPPIAPAPLPEGRRHPSRRAVKELTAGLEAELQRLLDSADSRLGVNHRGRSAV